MKRTEMKSVAMPLLLVVLVAPVVAAGESTEAVYRGWTKPIKFDVSPPLREIAPILVTEAPRNLTEPEAEIVVPFGPGDIDPVVQTSVVSVDIPGPTVAFNTLPNVFGFAPPDPVGDVGPNHYVAMSNVTFGVYDKTGTLLYGPAANNTLWTGFGGTCETRNDGDPIVVYDQLADRWLLTQFTASPPYYNCVAISTSPDPTGTYYRYAFPTLNGDFPDYPKYGIWEDAYYISTREFAGSFTGVGAYAIDRQQMIAGNPTPTMISFLIPPGANPENVGDGLLPSDLDGSTLPPPGSPNYFVGTMDTDRGAPQDAITLWEYHADFTTPASSTFTLVHTIATAPFDSAFPCSPGSRDCIPQPGTTRKIDALSYRRRPMHRLAYRNFGSHEALVTNQTVEATTGMAGLRWYEIRDPGGSPTIYQQGTYAPGATDGIHRWMGSIAQDANGNMALGYSASDATSTYPSIWYTGRLATDPLGTMPQGEGVIINGTGSQTATQRWGDYTSMNIDPVDDCTFWYINQYLPATSLANWQLRVGAFKFPGCTGGSIFADGFESGDTIRWSRTFP